MKARVPRLLFVGSSIALVATILLGEDVSDFSLGVWTAFGVAWFMTWAFK